MSGNTNTDILLAGAIATFTVDLLAYPLDTLKTRIQSPDYTRPYTNAATKAVNKPALFRGLYQGVGSAIIATLPSCVFFTTYERTKSLLTHINPATSSSPNGLIPLPILHAAASSTAELVSCAILTPAEVIKQNAQMVDTTPSSTSSTLAPETNATLQTLAKFRSNPSALWRGYTALAGRNLPFTALQSRYSSGCKKPQRHTGRGEACEQGRWQKSGLVTVASASTAGAIATVTATPADMVKTRVMLAAAENAASEASASKPEKSGSNGLVDAFGKTVKSGKEGVASAATALSPLASFGKKWRKSAIAIGREIVAEKGVKGLWRGGALRGVWTMLGSGLYLGVYESERIYLAGRRGENVKEEDLF